MRYWFSSDCHFSHFNIIRYCKRPFSTIEAMDNTIVNNFNSRMKPEDTLFHVGDWSFHNTKGGKEGEGTLTKDIEYENRINASIIRIQGNHENNNGKKIIMLNCVIKHGGYKMFLVHNPEHFNPEYKINLVGHRHEKMDYEIKDGCLLINVGVDNWNFMPVSIEDINKRYHKQIQEVLKKGK